MSKKPSTHYVNNPDFLQALIDYKEKCRIAQEENKSQPRVPDYIGMCFIKISENISRRGSFNQYTFRDEMVADAIENCLTGLKNFDPEKSLNPFGYFTQIIFYAFFRRIAKEKKQLYIKYKATEQCGILDEECLYEDENGNMKQFELYANISDFIRDYESSLEEKRRKKEEKLLRDFDLLENDDENI